MRRGRGNGRTPVSAGLDEAAVMADSPAWPWWRERAALDRVLRDLLAAQWRRLRPDTPPPASLYSDDDPDLAGDAFALDSLERLQTATAVAVFFEVHQSGLEDLLLARRRLSGWRDLLQDSLATYAASLVFSTGGSTGEPKRVRHSVAWLAQEIDALAALVGPCPRILSAVSAHHIYGFLMTVLLPQKLGAELVDVRSAMPTGLGETVAAGDLVVGVPAWWRLVTEGPAGWPANVQGLTSTAPCPPELAQALTEGRLTRLIEIYGSTETAGIGWRSDPAAPFRVFDHWRPGGDTTRLIRCAPDGSRQTIAAPDKLAWPDGHHVRPEGRADSVVQVGGHNIDLDAVRAVVVAHPEVAEAAVRPVTLGGEQRLKAFVVPACDAGPALSRRLDDHVAERLAPEARPRAWRFGDKLPRDPMGKVLDWPVGDATGPA